MELIRFTSLISANIMPLASVYGYEKIIFSVVNN